MTLGAFKRQLESDLGGLASITDIKMECPSKHEDRALQFYAALTSQTDDGDSLWFPSLGEFDIEFTVQIPARIQAEVTPGGGTPDTGSERFRVYVDHFYSAPITMISAIDPQGHYSPSTAIVVVREFLRRELGRTPATAITLEVLGPSPLHLDVLLVPRNDGSNNSLYRVVDHSTYGYDKLTFDYNVGILKTDERVRRVFLIEVLREVNFAYRVADTDQRKLFDAHEIEEQVNSIISMEQRAGVRSLWTRTFQSHGTINNAFISIARFEVNDIRTRRDLDSSFASLYSETSATYLKPVVKKLVEEQQEFPTTQFHSLLELFESRHLTNRELIAVLFSSVVGGLVGALITGLLTG